MISIRTLAALALAAVAFPALAEGPSAEAWAYAADEDFKPGTYGTPFIVLAQNEGCFDEEGLWTCAVHAEGIRFVTHEGSVTSAVILDILAQLPIGAEIEITGDMQPEVDGRAEAVFSRALPPM